MAIKKIENKVDPAVLLASNLVSKFTPPSKPLNSLYNALRSAAYGFPEGAISVEALVKALAEKLGRPDPSDPNS